MGRWGSCAVGVGGAAEREMRGSCREQCVMGEGCWGTMREERGGSGMRSEQRDRRGMGSATWSGSERGERGGWALTQTARASSS
jgi:hypothetical protein